MPVRGFCLPSSATGRRSGHGVASVSFGREDTAMCANWSAGGLYKRIVRRLIGFAILLPRLADHIDVFPVVSGVSDVRPHRLVLFISCVGCVVALRTVHSGDGDVDV